MYIPNFGAKPTERTKILLAYDDDYFYVAGRLYDSDPSKIQSTSKKRDYFGGNSNRFGFILDTFNDKENAVAFFTIPSGLRLNLTVFDNDLYLVYDEGMKTNRYQMPYLPVYSNRTILLKYSYTFKLQTN